MFAFMPEIKFQTKRRSFAVWVYDTIIAKVEAFSERGLIAVWGV